MKKLLILLLVTSCAFASCKKDDPEPQPTKTELISKTWTPKEVYMNGQVDNDPEWRDFRVEFKNNKTYIVTTSWGSDSGVWNFNSDETKVVLDGSETWDIIELNSSRLKIRFEDDTDKYEITWEPVS